MQLPFLKKKSSTIGLDIGSQAVKIIKLQHREGQPSRLVACGYIQIRPEDEAFTEAVTAYLKENKLSGSDTATVLDDSTMKIRKIELPHMPEADLREAVKFKMRDVMEGPTEDYAVQSSMLEEIGQQASKRYILVGYAVKKTAVSNLMATVSKLGLRPAFVEPSVVSLSASVQEVAASEEEWYAAIDLGATKSLMVVTGHGKFYFSRPLSGISLQIAQDPAGNFSQKLAAEIQHTLDTFSVTFRVEQITKLYLSGGGASIPDLPNYLTTNLGLHTEVLNPFTRLEVDGELAQSALVTESPFLFPQAISLARINVAT